MINDSAYEETIKVAAELYEKSGRVGGRDLDNWLEAERIVRERYAAKEERKCEVIESRNTKDVRHEIRKQKLVIVKGVQENIPNSSYCKTTNIGFEGTSIEKTKVVEKENGIKRLLCLREDEKTYLKSLDLLQTELMMIEEELQKAFEEMNQKKIKLYEIENEIDKLQARIHKFNYRNRTAAIIFVLSLLIFIGMLTWYYKPVASLFGVISLGLVVYGFYNIVNSHKLKNSVSKRNRENTSLVIDLATLRKIELFCKKRRDQKIDMIEKQRKEIEATAAKISEVKRSIVASEQNEEHHYEIVGQMNDSTSIKEKRHYKRRPIVRPVQYCLREGNELIKVEIKGAFVDIGEGGLGMTTDYPLMADDILFFKDEIRMNGFAAKSSTVRWSREIGESRCRVGLQFMR